jgi:hypothetical protein
MMVFLFDPTLRHKCQATGSCGWKQCLYVAYECNRHVSHGNIDWNIFVSSFITFLSVWITFVLNYTFSSRKNNLTLLLVFPLPAIKFGTTFSWFPLVRFSLTLKLSISLKLVKSVVGYSTLLLLLQKLYSAEWNKMATNGREVIIMKTPISVYPSVIWRYRWKIIQ